MLVDDEDKQRKLWLAGEGQLRLVVRRFDRCRCQATRQTQHGVRVARWWIGGVDRRATW